MFHQEKEGVDRLSNAVFCGARNLHRSDALSREVVIEVCHERFVQLQLRREVIVKNRFRHPGGFSDCRHAGVSITRVPKDAQSRSEYDRPALFTVESLADLVFRHVLSLPTDCTVHVDMYTTYPGVGYGHENI